MPDLTGIGSVADLATTVINKIWPDKSEQEKQQLAAALVYHYIARPMLPWLLALAGKPMPPIPPLDMGDLITILLGMLGLGGLRTYEKKQGVA